MKIVLFLICFVLAISSSSAQISFFDKGVEAFENEKYKQAVSLYTEQLKTKTGANIHFNRGLAYYQLKNYPAAIADFTFVLQKDPQDFEAYYNRGLAYYYHNDFDQSISDNETCIALNSEYSNAFTSLGMCYYKKEQYAQAMLIFDSVLTLNESASSYYNRALTFNKLKSFKAAENDFTKAINLEPNLRFYWGRADFYYAQNDFSKAIADYNEALALDSNSAPIYFNRGLCYYAGFKEEKAIEDFKKVLEIDSTDIDAKWYLCSTYYAQGNYEEALSLYNEVEAQNYSYGLLRDISKTELERKTLLQNNLVYVIALVVLVLLTLVFAFRLFKKKEVAQ